MWWIKRKIIPPGDPDFPSSPLLLVFLVVRVPHNRAQWVNYAQMYVETPSTSPGMQAGEFYTVFYNTVNLLQHSFGN